MFLISCCQTDFPWAVALGWRQGIHAHIVQNGPTREEVGPWSLLCPSLLPCHCMHFLSLVVPGHVV